MGGIMKEKKGEEKGWGWWREYKIDWWKGDGWKDGS